MPQWSRLNVVDPQAVAVYESVRLNLREYVPILVGLPADIPGQTDIVLL
jgi:hypothetical protein